MDVFAYVSWDDPQRAGRVMLVASPFGVNFGNSRLLVFEEPLVSICVTSVDLMPCRDRMVAGFPSPSRGESEPK